MSVAKITEITASSPNSFDDAMKDGIKRASKTIRNIEGAWIKDQKVIIKNGEVIEYRVNLKLSFVLDD